METVDDKVLQYMRELGKTTTSLLVLLIHEFPDMIVRRLREVEMALKEEYHRDNE